MLAVAAAVGGHIPNQILLLFAAVALAMFWRAVIKVGIAFILIVVAMMVINGDLTLFHALRSLIP
jgi:hypothetical protein